MKSFCDFFSPRVDVSAVSYDTIRLLSDSTHLECAMISLIILLMLILVCQDSFLDKKISFLVIHLLFFIGSMQYNVDLSKEKIRDLAIEQVSAQWKTWVDKGEIEDVPLKQIDVDRNFLKITIVSGDAYYIPFEDDNSRLFTQKRKLTFKYYKSKKNC